MELTSMLRTDAVKKSKFKKIGVSSNFKIRIICADHHLSTLLKNSEHAAGRHLLIIIIIDMSTLENI